VRLHRGRTREHRRQRRSGCGATFGQQPGRAHSPPRCPARRRALRRHSGRPEAAPPRAGDGRSCQRATPRREGGRWGCRALRLLPRGLLGRRFLERLARAPPKPASVECLRAGLLDWRPRSTRSPSTSVITHGSRRGSCSAWHGRACPRHVGDHRRGAAVGAEPMRAMPGFVVRDSVSNPAGPGGTVATARAGSIKTPFCTMPRFLRTMSGLLLRGLRPQVTGNPRRRWGLDLARSWPQRAVVRTMSTSVDDPLSRQIPCIHGLLRGT